MTCSSPAHALTLASLKSSCGSVDGEPLPAGGAVGAVKHRPGRSKTKTQTQGSSMTCISQTLVSRDTSGLVSRTWREDFWLMGKPF